MNFNDLFTDNFRYKLCNFINALLYKTKESICFKKEKLEEINQRVEKTKSDARKFKRVEENIPNFFKIANDLKEKNRILEEDNVLMFDRLSKLYEVDLSGNIELKKMLFKELGFDYYRSKLEEKKN